MGNIKVEGEISIGGNRDNGLMLLIGQRREKKFGKVK